MIVYVIYPSKLLVIWTTQLLIPSLLNHRARTMSIIWIIFRMVNYLTAPRLALNRTGGGTFLWSLHTNKGREKYQGGGGHSPKENQVSKVSADQMRT